MNLESATWRRSAIETEVLDEETLARRRRRRTIIIGVVVALIAIGIAFFMLTGPAEEVPAPAGQGAASLPAVTVVVPGKQQVSRSISATGTLAARRDMPVGVAGEGGMIARVLVEPGQWVDNGQTLAVIERSVQSQEVQQLAANVEVARADARLAQQELDRAQALVGRGFISKADVERRIATRDAANARVRVAQAQLGAARARVGRLDIRAPAAGLVLDRNVEAGQVVGAGSGALFRIAQGGQMELLARLAESDLEQVKVGMTASVTPVGSSKSFTGQIWQVSPVIDPQSRQGEARIALSYDSALRPGGFASATINVGTIDAPLLPQSAVQSDDRGNYVYIIDGNNAVVRRDVKVGEVSDQGVAIASGLSGNERVVQSAGAFLSPGQKVRPVRAASR
ncbi:efflux RND transporter periplasmic adaptor subunit [Sphingosinicella rhizophila]|uniref:Efflux RND transporter periplasmic adaptor subunit n=1 Tax=Sphingosinicella rhizophila TaxID=3050082 RepID=A0ABU3Q3X4_9SPHN|nr:efflux RND transporter periplasmic adaptor subunit [Sphingosinicella sp. GR2756]MDT9598113.1 efflux RND transporter periplasmic adaptor subunit [Sphingosinicella sp. GR2756]